VNARTIKTIRLMSAGIAAVGATASYGTQRSLLLSWGADRYSAAIIPLTVDLLAIICALVIHTPNVDTAGRKIAYRVLGLAGAVSITANAMSGHTVGLRVAHVWCVIAYLAAEAVAAKAKAASSSSEIDAVREALAAAQHAIREADARAVAAEQATVAAQADHAKELRAQRRRQQAEARKANTQPAAAPAVTTAPAMSSRLWTPGSPGDLEAIYAMPAAPVSPAPINTR
jgi:hypothetical protein